MVQINSLNQIESVMLQLIADALNEVAEEAAKLMQDNVEKEVYAVGTQKGREYYYAGSREPTGQLKESIIHTSPVANGNEVTATVEHDKDKMAFHADTFLHGSNYFSPNDVRELLPMFIDQGLTGGIFGPKWENLKRPYFSKTKQELEAGLFEKLMTAALQKRGVSVGVSYTMK